MKWFIGLFAGLFAALSAWIYRKGQHAGQMQAPREGDAVVTAARRQAARMILQASEEAKGDQLESLLIETEELRKRLREDADDS